MDPRIAAFVNYYAREGHFHRVQSVCSEVLKLGPSPAVLLWRAFGLLRSGATAEALRELDGLTNDPTAGPAAVAAMIAAQEASLRPDASAVAALCARLNSEEHTVAGEPAWHLTAMLAHTHNFERARAVLERCIREQRGAAALSGASLQPKEQQQVARLQAALGWAVLMQQLGEAAGEGDEAEVAAAARLFEAAIAADSSNIEAVMGRARVLELGGQLQAAADLAGEMAVRWPWFVPGLTERCRLLLAAGDWEGMAAAAQQLLAADSGNTLGLALTALHALLQDGDARAAAALLSELADSVVEKEPRNAKLAYELSRPFARLVAPSPSMLAVTLGMAQRAAALAPQDATYIAEVGHQRLQAEDLQAAAFHFEAAQHVDPLCIPAALGLAEVAIRSGRLGEAEVQLQMLPELMAAHAPLTSGTGTRRPSSGAGEHDPTVLVASSRKSGKAGGNGSSGSGAASDQQDDALGSNPEFLHLQGLLAWAKGSRADALPLLERAAQGLLARAEALPLGLTMFAALDASRALGAVRLLLGSLGADPRQAGDAPSPVLVKALRILEGLGRFTGQLPEAQLLHARALYLNGALDAAARKAAAAAQGAGSEDAAPHLLAVSIAVRQGRAEEAMAALEAAVAGNFSIREAPLYGIVHAQVLVANGRLEEAKKVLETAMAAPGVRAPLTAEQRERLARRGLEPSTQERASIYLLLAEVHSKLWAKQQSLAQQQVAGDAGLKQDGAPEARKLLEEAVRLFEGTSEEVRVTLADCEDAVARGDVDGALLRLQRVPPTSPHFVRSRTALADIHLRSRRDRAAYVHCYLDLVERTPDYDSYCLLGEAFLKIQEPEKAARAFELALELAPKDGAVALKAAEALATAHDYSRAVDYYNRAIRCDPEKVSTQHALAALLIKLRQLSQAKALLSQCLERVAGAAAAGRDGGGGGRRAGSGKAEALALEAETLMLLARLHVAAGEGSEFESFQRRAIEAQRALLFALKEDPTGGSSLAQSGGAGGGAGGTAGQAKDKLLALLTGLAEHHARARRFEQAQEAYEATLDVRPDHGPTQLALARTALALGDVESCQARCTSLLRADPDNDGAASMLAELLFHQENLDGSLLHFAQLLERRPCHYEALSQLLVLLRRAGKLEDAEKYLAAAEAAAAAASSNNSAGGALLAVATAAAGNSGAGGIHYCRGIQQRYLGNPREALRRLAAARKDPTWAARALAQMVEVYLSASASGSGDSDAWGAAASTQIASDAGGGGGVDKDGGAVDAASGAAALLQQIRPEDIDGTKHTVLSAYVRMATGRRADVESAVEGLLAAVSGDPNNVPLLLALAQGFTLLKQDAKAQAQLARIAKLPYQSEQGDDFERAWLALSEAKIAAGRADKAKELAARCLRHNRSCARAWELRGAAAEREGTAADAAAAYEAAWKLGGRSNPAVGYKLAASHLKAGRPVEAVSAAQAVLKADPEHPTIRRDVLERARALLRP